MPAHLEDLNDYQVDSWPSTPEGEERQAKELTEMYTILFEHPLVKAITTWDFTDGAWLHAPSGLLREDNTEKPSYHALYKLFREDWSTNATIQTDENGILSLDPSLKVIAPWRIWDMTSREDLMAYLDKKGLGYPASAKNPKLFSRDRNIWHISVAVMYVVFVTV